MLKKDQKINNYSLEDQDPWAHIEKHKTLRPKHKASLDCWGT
jgi:hypothetical protein